MALAEAPHQVNPALKALDTPFVRSSTKQTVLALLWALFDMDGECRSKSGNAGRKLVAEAQKIGYRIGPTFLNVKSSSLTQLLSEMDHGRYAGLISRETNGKRTYSIKLLLSEDQMPPRPPLLTVTDPPVPPDVEPEPEPPVETPEPEPEPAPEPENLVAGLTDPIEKLFAIQRLALEASIDIATQLGQASAPAPDQSELDALKAKLAETLEENQRLRRKVTEASETTNAKAKECEALRKALMVSASNLKTLQQASNQSGRLERNLANLKNVQSFMSATPNGGG